MTRINTLRRSTAALLTLAGLAVWLTGGARAEAPAHDQPLAERFLQEAPSRWEEYRRRAETVQGSWTFRITASDKQHNRHARAEYKANRNARLLLEQSLDPTDPRGRVSVINPRYAFTLRRKSPDDPWVIVRLDRLQSGQPPADLARWIDGYRHSITMLTELRSEPLPEVVRKPEFRVRRVNPVSRDGEDLVEVVFDYPHDPESTSQADYNPVQGGSMVLDPNRFWCVRSLDVGLKAAAATGRYQRQIRLSDPAAPLPLPGTATCVEDFQVLRVGSELDLTVSQPARLPDDAEFTLPAFGLPEPHDLGPHGSRWWYLLLAAIGTLCLIGGLTLKRFRRPT